MLKCCISINAVIVINLASSALITLFIPHHHPLMGVLILSSFYWWKNGCSENEIKQLGHPTNQWQSQNLNTDLINCKAPWLITTILEKQHRLLQTGEKHALWGWSLVVTVSEDKRLAWTRAHRDIIRGYQGVTACPLLIWGLKQFRLNLWSQTSQTSPCTRISGALIMKQFWLTRSGWGLIFCISNKLSGDANGIGPQTTWGDRLV